MDFSAIIDKITPYLNLSTIAIVIVTALAFFLKIKSVISSLNNKYGNIGKQLSESVRKVIPESVYLNIESLAKTELTKITENINKVINEEVLGQIKANTELVKAIAEALCSMKSLPDSSKKAIAEMLEIKNVETTASLKIELLPVEEKEEKQAGESAILID
jgi:hypothetical protein